MEEEEEEEEGRDREVLAGEVELLFGHFPPGKPGTYLPAHEGQELVEMGKAGGYLDGKLVLMLKFGRKAQSLKGAFCCV